jgi:hypothetical protein
MERAYDEAKYGRYSRRPYIDIVISVALRRHPWRHQDGT